MRPLTVLMLSIALSGLIMLAGWCMFPTPPPPVSTTTPTRLPITVLPTVFVFSTSTPVDAFTVPSPGVGDLLPMTPASRPATSTPVPPTETPAPTETPSKPPVQKGERWTGVS